MTVAAADAKAGPYTGNDVATTFAFAFKIFATSDIRVIETVIATGVETDLILNGANGYTVVKNNDQDNNPGGTITYRQANANAPLPATKKLTIVGNFAYSQPTDLPNGGPFFANVVENALDRLTMLVKQLREGFNRSLRLSVSDPAGSATEIPPISVRANNLLGFDANGNPVAVAPAAQSATALQALLATNAGAGMVGANDGAGGSLFTTMAGFITALASSVGASLTGFIQAGAGALGMTVQTKLRQFIHRSDYNSDANFNADKVGKLSQDGTGRVRAPAFIAGSEELVSPTTRDAFVVGRNLIGDTNCHGYADRTIISGVTDAGLYGSFDCTVELQGTHNQNHVYSYQDRVRYSGGVGGILQNSCGFLSQTIHSGAGTILNRNGVQIDPMAVTAGGVIDAQTGVRINHLGSATNNVGLFIGQTTGATGWAIYAPGSTAGVYPLNGAKSFLSGEVGFGLEPTPGLPITWKTNTSSSNKTGFLGSDATRATVGAIGDTQLAFVTNAQARILIDGSAGSYGLKPNADNGQPLGGAAFRWSVVYSATGAINTSDAREKEQGRSISDKEKAVALKIKAGLKAFKFKSSVAEKGDNARWHFGAYAQEVEAAFASEGLDAREYALFCFDEWPDEYETWGDEFVDIPAVFSTVVLEDGSPVEISPARRDLVRAAGQRLLVAGGNRYGIRYDELLAFVTAAI